ncbi:phosphoenolpyruvate synthase [candidate division MSBL1 archaeon SCGC-AAA382N08]|uniref:Phosphoenolpyruvate synthase n=1 Tax=candidate division MSBL1 archaeon SCGC-AAA382N08 TaxID=1698285 RepID=A0A133VQZ2_9EURY|nr:phosphoenolpyruvate synthase [candidate division MSBL1 archaeon SCGC-AAA382N08]
MPEDKNILWFEEITADNVEQVGGKNASLGEMYSQLVPKGVNIPNGFALTTEAFWYYLEENDLNKKIEELFEQANLNNLSELKRVGEEARSLIEAGEFPSDLKQEALEAYSQLSKEYDQEQLDVAVRSSGTAEDQIGASFAGQFETFLNVSEEEKLLESMKKCMASLFNDRAIAYKEEKGFSHLNIALSVTVQKMVRSDLASSGIMFTLDTETGFKDAVLINSIWGVGEMIVKGRITPDTFYVFKPKLKQGYDSIIRKDLGRKDKKLIYDAQGGLKEEKVSEEKQLEFSLDDGEILTLAEWACLIEDHYSEREGGWMPQDIEWAKDGKTGELFVVQSRPETVHSQEKETTLKEYDIETEEEPVVEGIAIGEKIGDGDVHVIPSVSEISEFEEGEVLVTEMTDPDWVVIMRKASAIVTDEGGKTSHAAIVSRELGVPCIVGSENATEVLETGQRVTVDCTQGLDGRVFDGKVSYDVKEYNLEKIPDLDTKIMVNIGAPEIAFKTSFLPQDGVGLAREEFIITEKIRVHPLALLYFDELEEYGGNQELKKEIEEITVEHDDKREFFVKELAEGIAQIAAAFYPEPVIVRFSDFKTNEYKNLVGGELFEEEEANPMLGFRGACRYLDEEFQPAFEMEVEAIERVREKFGLDNVDVMIPFCRTVEEGEQVIEVMEGAGLKREDLNVYVMCEIPSNVILADEFLDVFDGMSIGTNDLTQLSLGMDRDNAKIAGVSDERDPTIKKMLSKVINLSNQRDKYNGICGEAPSTYPEFAQFLQEEGIDSMSLNPNRVIKTILILAGEEDQIQ